MPVMPIPKDWDGTTWGCYLIEWPKSPTWQGLLAGFITTPLRGRFWDERTGTITAVQAIGREIEERNKLMSCEDISTAINNLITVVADINVAISNQVTVNQDLVNVVSAQANSFALAGAYSNAISSSYANATLIQAQYIDLRHYGAPYPPLTPEEAAGAGVDETSPNTPSEACAAAYWIVVSIEEVLKWMSEQIDNFWFASTEALLAFLAWSIKLGGETFGAPGAVKLPPAALTTIVEALQYLNEVSAVPIEDILDNLAAFLAAVREDAICDLVDAYTNEESAIVLPAIIARAESYGIDSDAFPVIAAFFNSTALAIIFYANVGASLPPLPPGFDCCVGQGI